MCEESCYSFIRCLLKDSIHESFKCVRIINKEIGMDKRYYNPVRILKNNLLFLGTTKYLDIGCSERKMILERIVIKITDENIKNILVKYIKEEIV